MKTLKNGEKKALISMHRHGYVLPLLFVLLFILILAPLLSPTATAGGYGDGCPFYNYYNGTLAHGGVYFECKGWYNEEPTAETETFENVPANRKIVRFYPGIWLGSPDEGRNIKWSFTFDNGHTENFSFTELKIPFCNKTAPPDDGTGESCTISCTGCGCCNVIYNASAYIVTGDNNITFWTNEQIYQFALLTVYENESMPPIQYWIKEGHEYPNETQLDGSPLPYYVYFNETANTGKIYLGSLKSVDYWNDGYPHLFGDPELNGHDIGGPNVKHSNTYDWIFYGWLNNIIPADYITTQSNAFKYEGFDNARMMAAVLALNYYDPSNLTVTDISPESLVANWSNGINAKIVNYGKTARLFNVTLYANDEVVDVRRVENLGEGENRTVKLFWKPSSTGPYVLNVTADIEDVVLETDETNNSKTLDVEVTTTSPPAWQSPSSNVSTIPNGGTIELRAQGIADVGLHNAILATDETGTWMNCTDYGSPSDMASYYNYSVTHTTESDWNNQTKENLSIVDGDMRLSQYGTGSENLARDKTCYASSEGYYPKENANDGDHSSLSSVWLSATGDMPCWWYVDLGDVKDVNKIKFYGSSYSSPLQYKILISNDGTTWTEKTNRYSSTTVDSPDNYTLLGWSCRYINVTITKNEYGGGQTWGGFGELEVYPPLGYNSDGTLTSKTIETDNPIISLTPTWNATVPTATSLSINISVNNGATWNTAVNGTALTWDYDGNNTKLKYKVLFETTDVNETPVLHDITLNYTTKDPVEGEWLWSNFTWHNASIPNGTTVAWKIYYEDMLGQMNCTAEETFYVGETGGEANVVVTVHNVSFGNMLAGDNTTIYISLTLNNSEGTAPATIEAVFKTNVSVVYGLNGTGANIISGNNFELGSDTNEKALTSNTTKTFISSLPAGENVTYNAILTVPAGQAADDYSGIVELSW